MTTRRSVIVGVLLSMWATGCAGTTEAPSPSADTNLITLNRAVHFLSPDEADAVAGPGKYRVEATEDSYLRLVPHTEGASFTIQALPSTHEVTVIAPVALAIPQGEDEQHVVLILPGGKSLDAVGSFSGIHGRGTKVTLAPSVIQMAAIQQGPAVAQRLLQQDPCSMGNGPQPTITRWLPNGRVWPGGKIVFEGQNLDASRFEAVVGSPRISLTILSASPTRIETQVPILPEGGPYTLSTGERLVVSYRGTLGCKILNPTFVVAEAFTLKPFPEAGGGNTGYSWIRNQMNIAGEIEGARSVTLLPRTDPTVQNLFSDLRVVCDWVELTQSGRSIILSNNRINSAFIGFFRDNRNPASSLPTACKLPVRVVIQDPFTNVSRNELFVIPMTIRTPRTVTVDTNKVFHTFQGVAPSLPPFGAPTGAMGDCGKLYANDPTGGPNNTIGVTVQNNDYVFTIKSGVIATICRFNSRPVEANLGVAFGPHIGWEVTNAGDAKKCHATPSLGSNGTIGILHKLESMQVYLSCDPGPLGDNRVTIRATSIDLLVPHEYMPPAVSLEVQN